MIRVVLLLLVSIALHGNGVSTTSPTSALAARKASPWPRTRVRVYNNLGEDIVLNLHCKSKNNDIGTQLLVNGNFCEWKFRPNVWGTTKFICQMEWGKMKGTFNIYVAERDAVRCLDCVWKVTKDGVKGYSKEGGVEQIWFRWPPA